MGHIISKDGLQTDPEKVKAIAEFPPPTNVEQLCHFLGMVNYLAQYVPNLTTMAHPLFNLLKHDVSWQWSSSQEDAFTNVQHAITSTPTLHFFDPSKELTLENDASDYGIGSALLQEGKPVAFASRSLTPSERNYAQLEKEMLAAVYGLEKFHQYTYGRHLTVVTDHKPLVAISKKSLSKSPKSLQSYCYAHRCTTSTLSTALARNFICPMPCHVRHSVTWPLRTNSLRITSSTLPFLLTGCLSYISHQSR